MSSTSRIHLAIVLSALVPSWGGMALHAQAPGPGAHPPPKEGIELSADWSEAVLRSRTVAVLVNRRPLLRHDGKDLAMSFRGGQADSQKAKIDAEKALADWGRFSVVSDGAEADLVLAILEETIDPNYLSEGTFVSGIRSWCFADAARASLSGRRVSRRMDSLRASEPRRRGASSRDFAMLSRRPTEAGSERFPLRLLPDA